MGYYLLDPANDCSQTVPVTQMRRLGDVVGHASTTTPLPGSTDNGRLSRLPIDGGIIPDETEQFWLFNLSLPIVPQLQAARASLLRAQQLRFGKKLQAARCEPGLFVNYLRLLDADAQGATDPEIIKVFYAELDGFTYQDRSGTTYPNEKSHRNPARDMLKNHRSAAYYLRDSGFRLLS
jgi:hypothetical protein